MVMDPWTVMASGDIVGAILASFTNIMGGWFYGAILFSIVAMVYIKTQDISITAFVMLVAGFAMSTLFADISIVYTTMAVLTVVIVAAVLYKLIARG
jgi:hypothetical protein